MIQINEKRTTVVSLTLKKQHKKAADKSDTSFSTLIFS
jgi:hypothetical protein